MVPFKAVSNMKSWYSTTCNTKIVSLTSSAWNFSVWTNRTIFTFYIFAVSQYSSLLLSISSLSEDDDLPTKSQKSPTSFPANIQTYNKSDIGVLFSLVSDSLFKMYSLISLIPYSRKKIFFHHLHDFLIKPYDHAYWSALSTSLNIQIVLYDNF